MSVGVHRRRYEVARSSRETEVTTGVPAWPWGGFDVAVGAWSPAVDVIDRPGEVVVRADLPGFDREDIQLMAEPELLHLQGVRRLAADTMPGDSYHCVERWSGPFGRTIRLPAAVDAGQMTATVTLGVLEVRLPKRAGRPSVEGQTDDELARSLETGRATPGNSGPGFVPARAVHIT